MKMSKQEIAVEKIQKLLTSIITKEVDDMVNRYASFTLAGINDRWALAEMENLWQKNSTADEKPEKGNDCGKE